jgi:hypothetical protein
MQFINLASVKDALAELSKYETYAKPRQGKRHKGPLTLAEIAALTDRERRNLANLVSRRNRDSQ